MAAELTPQDLERLQSFINICKANPETLNLPPLNFFREFIESLGGTIPEPETKAEETKIEDDIPSKPTTPPPPPEVESEESEVEFDMEGVISGEDIEFPELGDSSKVASEEDEINAVEKRQEAMSAMAEGDFDKSVSLFTEAIKLNPTSAMLYAKRGSILLKQKRVKAALRDCEEALKINPDCASAYKFRGRAHRLLGNWLESVKDLRTACKLDFDEQADEWLKEVQPNATKLEEHQRKYERKRIEKENRERQERIRKAQEAAKQAQSEQKSHDDSDPFSGAGGRGGPSFSELFSDPEIMAAMQDPEVAQAFQDVSSNPANFMKYQNNPKVAAVMNKLLKNFSGSGGMPGGFPGGCAGGGCPGSMPGGFPGGFDGSGGSSSSNPKSSSTDDLD